MRIKAAGSLIDRILRHHDEPQRRLVLTMDHDYQRLGVHSGASSGEIKAAYRDLIRVWHPDRFEPGSTLRAKAEETLKEINAAYRRLSRVRPSRGRGISASRKRSRAEWRRWIRRPNFSPVAHRESPAYSRSDTVLTARLGIGFGLLVIIGVVVVGLGAFFNTRAALPENAKRGATVTNQSLGPPAAGSSDTLKSSPPDFKGVAPGPQLVRPSEAAELSGPATRRQAAADLPARVMNEPSKAAGRRAPRSAAEIIRLGTDAVPGSIRLRVDRPRPPSSGNAERDVDASFRRHDAPPTVGDVDPAVIERILKERPRSAAGGEGQNDRGVADRSRSAARMADSVDPGAPIDWLLHKAVR